MIIYPAIDLYGGKAVRLYKGDYAQMTVYSEHPEEICEDFLRSGASRCHLVDLEGARDGNTPNMETVKKIAAMNDLFTEIGGGIRSIQVIDRYLNAGIDRVILGTAAVKDPAFLEEAIRNFGKAVAVGVDIKDGYVAVKGWTETSDCEAISFCKRMEAMGVGTLICTDISKDGAMQGTNRDLYRILKEQVKLDIIASGGVSTIEDVKALAAMDIHGAIIGKAYYTGSISLQEAIEVAR